VWRDGVKLPGDDALLITEPATFVLDGFGELTVLPGGDNLETIAVAEKELRAKFQRALAGTGCQSILQAEEQEREKTRILAEGDEALRDVLKFAPAGIAALVDERDGLQARLRDSGGQSVAMAPQAVLEAEAMAEALRSKREQLKEQCAKQRTLVQQCSQSLAAVNAQLQALLAEQNVLNTQIAACEAKLQELRQQEADQALDQRMTEARVQWENITAQCTTLEAQLAGSSAELAQTCVAEAQAEVGRLQLHFQHLRERRSMLQGILQTFGKSGIAEEYCRLKDKYEQMQRHCQRLLLKANAIKLLHQTLLDCERRSKDGLTQPLLAQMKPYIERVFDQAAIVLDGDSYQITGLQRGTSMEAYGSLSLGTREQLSVLVRLAFAQVLTANGYPAIVVLDDALVYADETRFARMQSVIAEAAAKFQILVFTCRLRDWQHMRSPIFRIEQDVMSKSLALRSDGQLFVNAALEQVAQQP
jgi:chromosome segregation ATPase